MSSVSLLPLQGWTDGLGVINRCCPMCFPLLSLFPSFSSHLLAGFNSPHSQPNSVFIPVSKKAESLEQPDLLCTCTFTQIVCTHTEVNTCAGTYSNTIALVKQASSAMLICKMFFDIHKELQLHAEPTVHLQMHSQPESISVFRAHSLNELTTVKASIKLTHMLIKPIRCIEMVPIQSIQIYGNNKILM